MTHEYSRDDGAFFILLVGMVFVGNRAYVLSKVRMPLLAVRAMSTAMGLMTSLWELPSISTGLISMFLLQT